MNDQDYITFEGYISKTLSEEDIADFEMRIERDQDFKQAFKTYKELHSFLEYKFENEENSKSFKDNLDTISKSYFKTESTSKKVLRFAPWNYAVAASVIVLLGFFLFNNFSDPSYSNFSNHDQISLIERGVQAKDVEAAETAFNTKDYSKANLAFKGLLELDSTNTEYQFYRAISNIELDNFEEAEVLLGNLKDGDSGYKYKAIWYLALSKLKQKDYPACVGLLKTIPKEAEDYKSALKLLKKLD